MAVEQPESFSIKIPATDVSEIRWDECGDGLVILIQVGERQEKIQAIYVSHECTVIVKDESIWIEV